MGRSRGGAVGLVDVDVDVAVAVSFGYMTEEWWLEG